VRVITVVGAAVVLFVGGFIAGARYSQHDQRPLAPPTLESVRNPRNETTVFEVEAGDRVRLSILRAEMPTD
jgi:hypothetical protein